MDFIHYQDLDGQQIAVNMALVSKMVPDPDNGRVTKLTTIDGKLIYVLASFADVLKDVKARKP